jgi:uncharacterized protein YqhQ
VPDLDEASGLADVHDVSDRQVTLLKSNCGTEFKNFVSLVASILVDFVSFLETNRSALWLHIVPIIIIDD